MITRRDVLIALGRGDLDGVPIAHKDLFETNTHELGGGVTTIHPFFGMSRFEAPVPTGLERAAANRALRDDQRSVRERFADLDLDPDAHGAGDGAAHRRPHCRRRPSANTWPFNAARTPALTVPAGRTRTGCRWASSWQPHPTPMACHYGPPVPSSTSSGGRPDVQLWPERTDRKRQ